ncbi:MAG: hypothetical protein O3C40_22210 [Planctomycetota bacterium]|nr:hypothetical protein [Planctomycetota bacterium]
MAKGLELVLDDGKVAMVQPAGPWLYHRAEPAILLRKRLFKTCTVDEVTNLSAIRRELFTDAIGPACIIVVGKEQPTPETELSYFAPKPLKTNRPTKPRKSKIPIGNFTIEPQDVSRISHHEAANDPLVWPVLSMGGRRDLNLIRKLSSYETLAKLEEKNKVLTREGVVPGDRMKALPELKDKPYLDATRFADDVFLELDASVIPTWNEPKVHSKDSTDFDAFKNPQLLIKQGYSVKNGRFRAALVRSNDPTWGVICNQTYLSVRDLSPDSLHVPAACFVYNSLFAVYFFALIGSRFPHYRTEMPVKELMSLPLPGSSIDLSDIDRFETIDELTRKLFALTKADWTLVEDLLEFTLPDALRMAPGPGRQKTKRDDSHDGSEPELSVYAQTMFRVLKSTFGSDKAVAATIYQEPHGQPLPVRMVTLHFDWPGRKPLTVEPIEADGLLDELAKFHRDTLQRKTRTANGTGLGFQRVAFFFHSHQAEHGRVRNLTIIKPDERRYWTRSLAMRDADDLAAAIFKAAGWKGERS